MSLTLALREMQRFLSNSEPEVLSVSGRWGVGKTFGWNKVLSEACAEGAVPITRYAYVSAFGLNSLDSLKAAVVQSTVNLKNGPIEPTVESFLENISTVSGLKNLAERGARKGFGFLNSIKSAFPYGKEAAEVIFPGAALLIKGQIICIDDLERRGRDLSILDILGFISMLREEKKCKIVLLLNEEGLGEDREDFRKYLEKTVDQSIHFSPTPQESANIACSPPEKFDDPLSRCIKQLGITNIRVIKRIRRFLGILLPEFATLHPTVAQQATNTVALLGWSLFEPTLAPSLDYLKNRNAIAQMLADQPLTEEESRWNALLTGYNFNDADDFDLTILAGLQSGAFDFEALKREAAKLHEEFSNEDARNGIREPWNLLGDSFDDNEQEFRAALIESVEKFARDMGPAEFDDVYSTLKDLNDAENANRLLAHYMAAQHDRPRGFFIMRNFHLRRPVSPEIAAGFVAKLATMPLERDPLTTLEKIDDERSWNADDEVFLASVSEEEYFTMLKAARGGQLQSVVRAALQFGGFQGANPHQDEIVRKMRAALRRIGQENPLNLMRVRQYLGSDQHQTEA